MRKLVFFIVIQIFSIAIIAQNAKVDSLERSLKILKGKQSVKAMNELSLLLASENPAKAETLANNALEVAKRSGDWRGMADAYDNLGEVFSLRLRYLKALDNYQRSLALRKQAVDELGQAQSNIRIGSTFRLLDDPDQAAQTLLEALALAKRSNWENGVAQAHDILGEISLGKAAYPDAQLHFKASFKIWSRLSQHNKAEESAKKIAETAANLGDLYSAESYLKQALAFASQSGNDKKIAAINQSLAITLLAKNDFEEAERITQLAFDANLKHANTLAMAENHWVFGKIALARSDKTACLERFERARLLLENKEPSMEVVTILDKLFKSAENINEVALSKKLEKDLLLAKSSLAEKKLITNGKLLHELLADRADAVLLQDKVETLEGASSNEKRIRTLMFMLLGLLGFMSALVYIFYKKNVKDNEQLLTQHEEIKLQEAEQVDLNKELGMKNISLEMLNKKLVEEIAERENIERSSFARDRFLATMSHEMRNPLNVITGLTHLLMEQEPRPDQVEQLRTLQFSANELVVFINDVLDFSKIEAGKLDLQSREFDLAETANMIFSNFEKKALDKKLHFYCSFDNRIPRRLVGDDSRFYQILNNLLSNCLESTSDGMVRAEVFSEEQKEREIFVKLVVECSDGGKQRSLPGREQTWDDAENHQENLNPLQLSLAITKRLVELQHGRFEIENVFGEATRFTVLMPFKKAFHLQNNIIKLDQTDYSQLSGVKVLVVEDNKINQLVVAKMLSQKGMSVITADNGYEALEQVELHHFDLILMDIQMPEMDGYRATAEIRNHPSQSKHNVPIIALTSSAFLTEKDKAVLFGMTDYVGKPFSPDELLEKIVSCLEFNKRY